MKNILKIEEFMFVDISASEFWVLVIMSNWVWIYVECMFTVEMFCVDMSLHSPAAFPAKVVSHPTCRHPCQILKVLSEASHWFCFAFLYCLVSAFECLTVWYQIKNLVPILPKKALIHSLYLYSSVRFEVEHFRDGNAQVSFYSKNRILFDRSTVTLL